MLRPVPSSSDASRRMAKVRQKGTDAEVALRREMYRIGLRYRINYEVLRRPRRVADVAFPGRRIAVFVDGCFWHGCPEHATWPKQNAKFWREKIEANQRRDADTNDRMRSLGWTVLRFWSHEPPTEAARTIAHMIALADSKLWAVAEIAYLCRLRGVEVVTLTEAAAEADGLRTNRRKGSRDNIVRWTPRLRCAWDALIARRDRIWAEKHTPIPMRTDQRPVVIAADGGRLSKSALDTAWQRCMTLAVAAGTLTEAQRFGIHDLKRRGITDTTGTRADKQDASGHRSAGMMDVYDLSLPVVPAAGE